MRIGRYQLSLHKPGLELSPGEYGLAQFPLKFIDIPLGETEQEATPRKALHLRSIAVLDDPEADGFSRSGEESLGQSGAGESAPGAASPAKRPAPDFPPPTLTAELIARFELEPLSRRPDQGESHVGFTRYSFGRPSSKTIDFAEGNCDSSALFRARAEHEDAKTVDIGSTETSLKHLFTDSLISCVPVIAYYPSGDIVLHHGSSYHEDSLQALLDGQFRHGHFISTTLDGHELGPPSDVFIVNRPMRNIGRQTMVAWHIIERARRGTAVHLAELGKRGTLAVDVKRDGLSLFLETV